MRRAIPSGIAIGTETNCAPIVSLGFQPNPFTVPYDLISAAGAAHGVLWQVRHASSLIVIGRARLSVGPLAAFENIGRLQAGLPFRMQGIGGVGLHPAGKAFIQPQIVPPSHGDKVAKPLVRHFMGDDQKDELPLELEELFDDFLLEDPEELEEPDFAADGEADGEAVEEDEGDDAFDSEYAGTSDVDPALAAAWTPAETDWLFCCAALT